MNDHPLEFQNCHISAWADIPACLTSTNGKLVTLCCRELSQETEISSATLVLTELNQIVYVLYFLPEIFTQQYLLHVIQVWSTMVN